MQVLLAGIQNHPAFHQAEPLAAKKICAAAAGADRAAKKK
jgi:hypothetical protein